VWGGADNDMLYGEGGHDKLNGGAGDDEAWGGDSHDHLRGEDGNDVLHGEGGKDHVYGGLGVDELYGGGDKDHLYGQGDMDWLNGGDSQDKLWGGWGDDWIKGGWGNDHLNGNEGIDTLDGDEGFNKYWNGELIVTDMPETPPDGWGEPEVPEEPQDPQDPSFVTTLGDATLGVTFTYTNVGGADHTLEVSGHGFLPDNTLVFMFIGGSGLPEVYSDAAGAFHVKFSAVPDAGELSFGDFVPDTYLFHGADIFVSDGVHPELAGFLNMA
jgi:Ca2+-binding RTX toxin-like protein